MTDVVLAIDFGGTKTAVGCATTEGDLLLSHRMPTYPSPSERAVAGVVGRALATAARLREQAAERPGWTHSASSRMNVAERLREPLPAALAKISPFPAEIVPSAFPRDASLLSAALAGDAVAGR
jgi:hypothetical protein